MVARITLAEIDAVRMSIEHAVDVWNEELLPGLREADGYEGCYVLTTPEGKAAVMTFWRDEEAARRSIASGLYGANVERFAAVLRASPGRESYEVAVADVPTAMHS